MKSEFVFKNLQAIILYPPNQMILYLGQLVLKIL